jgi:DNA-binding protein YbaB
MKDKFNHLQAKMDEELANMQSEMVEKYLATGKSTNGLVHVMMDADHFIKGIKIDDSIQQQHMQQVNKWMQEATNDAIFQVNQELEKRAGSIIFDFLAKASKIIDK